MIEKQELKEILSIEKYVAEVVEHLNKPKKLKKDPGAIIEYLQRYQSVEGYVVDTINYIQTYIQLFSIKGPIEELLSTLRVYCQQLPFENIVVDLISLLLRKLNVPLEDRAGEILQIFRKYGNLPLEGHAEEIINYILKYSQDRNFEDGIKAIITCLQQYASQPCNYEAECIVKYLGKHYEYFPFEEHVERIVNYLEGYFQELDVAVYFNEGSHHGRLFHKNEQINTMFTDEALKKFCNMINPIEMNFSDFNLNYIRKIINYYFHAIEQSEQWKQFLNKKNIPVPEQNQIKWAFFYGLLSALGSSDSLQDYWQQVGMKVPFVNLVGSILVNKSDNLSVKISVQDLCLEKINRSGQCYSKISGKKQPILYYSMLLALYDNNRREVNLLINEYNESKQPSNKNTIGGGKKNSEFIQLKSSGERKMLRPKKKRKNIDDSQLMDETHKSNVGDLQDKKAKSLDLQPENNIKQSNNNNRFFSINMTRSPNLSSSSYSLDGSKLKSGGVL